MWCYYNTGDQVWMEWRSNKWEVVRVLTHDNISWRESEPCLTKLVGMEKFFHRITVASLKLAHKVLTAG
jgi:hypothetical protein